ncbi:hypothetical protein QBC46DRAFT_447950 [Diplogelasinospora grovesii]|uniref:Uncharacterized protein n=1 Tax=Diplogelasinospora grovesii TaxID=303347 RepID=A0AAN6NBC9_9PEZI|nr:hypothetical protein QBC46DRAFT_447950 [Diplogelasinospora grovesii]
MGGEWRELLLESSLADVPILAARSSSHEDKSQQLPDLHLIVHAHPAINPTSIQAIHPNVSIIYFNVQTVFYSATSSKRLSSHSATTDLSLLPPFLTPVVELINPASSIDNLQQTTTSNHIFSTLINSTNSTLTYQSQFIKMTRSHKYNDKDHHAIAEGLPQEEHIPKFFAKHGFPDADPKKTKKNGGGKGNWYVVIVLSPLSDLVQFPRQRYPSVTSIHSQHQTLTSYVYRGHEGEEVVDDPTLNFANARRPSNSSGISHHLEAFKTKFEVNEPEPVFEENLHGAPEDEELLIKTDTTSSSGGSVDEELHKKDN